MAIAIQTENLSKAYQLGEIGTGTISRDLERWWAGVRGKEDPFLKIGQVNDRTVKGGNDIVWSLKDINFRIEQGEAVGIIGRNGAGKSTLLKVLSRVTSPTTGRISGKGRIASLLEVGTGFHPELTGRENIYLNGAILGMRKKEISRHFDEIVSFAGVEKYVDTPVKRYSSGMYVRLAFAVAAHLESEILIVDEVLAVGDAEFQEKCLGKMNAVSKGEGRTVLFVSHNMGSVAQLCSKGMLLNNGILEFSGSAAETIKQYTRRESNLLEDIKLDGTLKNRVGLKSISINKNTGLLDLKPEAAVRVSLQYNILEPIPAFRISFIFSKEGTRLLTVHDLPLCESIERGTYCSEIVLPPYLLRPGDYTISVGGHNTNHSHYSVGGVEWFYAPDIYSFSVLEKWGPEFDFNNIGMINLPNNGLRIKLQA